MAIYVNETGFYANAPKHANVTEGANSVITLCKIDGDNTQIIKKYDVKDSSLQELSGEITGIVDFSEITEEGCYYLEDDNNNRSCRFNISPAPFDNLADAALKMFYFQRCGCELPEKYAGIYKHKICHNNNVTHIYDKSINFECNGGWHDAGDFGRYSTAGAVALAHLLYAYKLWPQSFTREINIPESGNGTPDILNECRYELEWLLKMQTNDGSVYHKCTSMHHAPFTMPEDDHLPFVVTPVSSVATADFAGVCALASSVYKPFDSAFANKLKDAAIKAGQWLDENPAHLYANPKECTTGDYGDMSDLDERFWAETELYMLDKDEKHIHKLNSFLDTKLDITGMGWMDVGGFGSMCILANSDSFPAKILDQVTNTLLDEADRLVKVSTTNIFEVAMHTFNFKWGSNMVLLNNAIVLCLASMICNKSDNDSDIPKKYAETALYQIDYLLGRNAMDVSYVTGFGEHAFKNPHNRPTSSDGIDEPIPGFVSGGPNINHCDEASLRLIPEGTAPMKCFVDDWGSYSTNEITIYWNSPLVFTLAYLNQYYDN